MGNMIQHWKQWEYNGIRIKHLPTGAGFLQQYVSLYITYEGSRRHNDLEIEFPKQMTVAIVVEMLGLTLTLVKISRSMSIYFGVI